MWDLCLLDENSEIKIKISNTLTTMNYCNISKLLANFFFFFNFQKIIIGVGYTLFYKKLQYESALCRNIFAAGLS